MRAALRGILALFAVSAPVGAQETCRPELVHAVRGVQQVPRPGVLRYFAAGDVLIRCVGNATTLRADSLAWFQDLDRMDFIGHVRFEDDTTTLSADQARYFPSDERLDAAGNVRLRNRVSNSTLSGPTLTYWRVARGVRDTAVMLATGRPTVEYRSSNDTLQAPYIIVADRVRLTGGNLAGANGAVTIDREDFAARSDSAVLDFDAGTGLLVGHGSARSTDTTGYTIDGRNLAYRLEDDALRWVQARGGARATSQDWRVVGDTIEFDVANDQVQGGRVWSDTTVVHALSELHTVEGDSVAIDSPGQVLREVRAFGRGRATARRTVEAPEVDWVAGDTVTAAFTQPDSGKSELTSLDAGGSARAYYHVFAEAADSSAGPAIAYSRGRRITVRFKGQDLERVDVVDQADGVYLQPIPKRP